MLERCASCLFPALLVVLVASDYATDAHAGTIAPQFTCGNVTDPASITAGDALAVLRTAVQIEEHSLCACDTDGSGSITASDALRTLKAAVGQDVSMKCPFCCAACGCTPQKLTLTMSDVSRCEGCIPRVPQSHTDVDSILISIEDVLNDSFELTAVAECDWRASIPDALTFKRYFGSGVADCTGSFGESGPGDVPLRVLRTDAGWEAYVGDYAVALTWGDMARAVVAAETCDVGGSAPSENETCHLAEIGNLSDQDTHAVGGTVEIDVPSQKPVCP